MIKETDVNAKVWMPAERVPAAFSEWFKGRLAAERERFAVAAEDESGRRFMAFKVNGRMCYGK